MTYVLIIERLFVISPAYLFLCTIRIYVTACVYYYMQLDMFNNRKNKTQ